MKLNLILYDDLHSNYWHKQNCNHLGKEPNDKENVSNDIYRSVFSNDNRPDKVKKKHTEAI